MSTPARTLQNFFSSFSIPAYEENSVPKDASFPYITYEGIAGSFEDGGNQCNMSVWYRTSNENTINAKVQEIRNYLGLGGIQFSCDGGFIWIKRGNPFCQNMNDPNDDKIKRRLIILDIEFLIQ